MEFKEDKLGTGIEKGTACAKIQDMHEVSNGGGGSGMTNSTARCQATVSTIVDRLVLLEAGYLGTILSR